MSSKYGFDLVESREISEVNSIANLYIHRNTGARLLSMVNDDENKVFSITFRTPPADSTGLPHIMEHSVLCGSRKYPVKEPFVELLKGSFNTFLNAFTMPDRTVYPVASTNEKDFYNLVDVYLDAVLFPLIPIETLQQEGWHYELEDIDQPLDYKGVVFNEMKGVYSSPESLLYKYSQEALFPDTVYSFDSGGDPAVIPNLTYQQFKQFHETFYHPSNAYIFFSGDDPEDKRLGLLDSYLSQYNHSDVNVIIAPQELFSQPRRAVFGYDTDGDQEKDKHYITLNWMFPNPENIETLLGLDILSHVLFGSPASPLRKALTESGLGEDLAGRGTDDSLLQISFTAGMKGVSKENLDKVEALILETLHNLVQSGIDQDTVAASMNTVEFVLRENNTGSYPRGLVVMMRILRDWVFRNDPFSALAFEEPLTQIKIKLDAGEPYFEGLIKEYLLDNSHRVTVVLEPDSQIGEERAAAERAQLDLAKKEMNLGTLEDIIANVEALKLRQETPDTPEALATIPRLHLDDLEKEVRSIPIDVSRLNDATLLYHDLFTNEILYLDLGFDMRYLPQNLLAYIPLFGRALVEIGTGSNDYVSLAQKIGRSTGGIYTSRFISAAVQQGDFAARFILRGKATLEHVQELLDILKELLLDVQLDNRTLFKQMVLEAKARAEAGIIPGGHRIVNQRLKAAFNITEYISEQMSGVENLFFLRRLIEKIESDWSGVLEDLETIRRNLITQNNLVVNCTIEASSWETVQEKVGQFIQLVPTADLSFQTWYAEELAGNEGLIIPAQVNYVGKGASLFDHGFKMHGSVYVINNYLQTTWLWEKIRVQGGAYGGFSTFDQLSGIFTFLSYRDPNLLGTLKNYDGSAQFLRNLSISENELTKSIIGVISDLDGYQLPDAKGYTSMVRYLVGITDAHRQRIRDEVLATTPADFHKFASILESVAQNGRTVVLGSQKLIDDVNQQKNNWLKVTKVL